MFTMTGKKTVFRRADTGRFTTEEFAKQHPRTTVRQTIWLTKSMKDKIKKS